MRYLILALLSLPAQAARVEAILGGVTAHVLARDPEVASKFAHKLNDKGLIFNPTLTVRVTPDKYSYSLLVGENSIGNGILGAMVSRGGTYGRLQILGTVGFYYQDSDAFKRLRIAPVGFGNLVPVVGIELNLELYRASNRVIRLSNLLSPVITHHGLSFGVEL